MAYLSNKQPRVFIEQPDGTTLEVKVKGIATHQEFDLKGYIRVEIEGYLTPNLYKSPKESPRHEMHTGEPINCGGIPPEVILRCPRCAYLNPEWMHTCSE